MNKLYCLSCPNGCLLNVIGSGEAMVVDGNGCEKGLEFAGAELDKPMRVITTVVRTSFPEVPVISVKTDGEIPKDDVMEALSEINEITIHNELDIGSVLIEDVAETGVPVVLTSGELMKIGAELENKNADLRKAGAAPPPQSADATDGAGADGDGSTGGGAGGGIGSVAGEADYYSADPVEGVLDDIGEDYVGGVVGAAGEAVGVADGELDGSDDSGGSGRGKRRGRARIDM